MARTWRTRPSELLELADPWEAFELDEAVLLAGDYIEGQIAQAEADAISGKRDPAAAAKRALEDCLGITRAPERRRRGAPRFRYDLSGGRVQVSRNAEPELEE